MQLLSNISGAYGPTCPLYGQRLPTSPPLAPVI